MLLHEPASKTNPKLVRTHSASIWCWDKPWATLDSLDSPRPGLGGSHHLPPYSIICVTPWEPHPNGTFSWDSQGGVPKLSRVELPGLWTLISPDSNLQLEWGLNQSCSSPWELSNALSHSFCRRWEEVDSRLIVVGSQTASLTPGPSFAHNLGCKCPNGSCEAILDIYTSKKFQRYKEHLKARCFALCCRALKLQESRRTPKFPLLWVWVSSSHFAQSGVATPLVSSMWPIFGLCSFLYMLNHTIRWINNFENINFMMYWQGIKYLKNNFMFHG